MLWNLKIKIYCPNLFTDCPRNLRMCHSFYWIDTDWLTDFFFFLVEKMVKCIPLKISREVYKAELSSIVQFQHEINCVQICIILSCIETASGARPDSIFINQWNQQRHMLLWALFVLFDLWTLLFKIKSRLLFCFAFIIF